MALTWCLALKASGGAGLYPRVGKQVFLVFRDDESDRKRQQIDKGLGFWEGVGVRSKKVGPQGFEVVPCPRSLALGFREVACWVMGSRVREAWGFRRFRV